LHDQTDREHSQGISEAIDSVIKKIAQLGAHPSVLCMSTIQIIEQLCEIWFDLDS